MVNSYEEGYLGFYNVLHRMIEGNFDEWTIFLWKKIGRRLVCRHESEILKVEQRVIDEIFSNPAIVEDILERIDMHTLDSEEIVICQEHNNDFTTIKESMNPKGKEILLNIDTSLINNGICIVIYKEEPDITLLKFWTPVPYLF